MRNYQLYMIFIGLFTLSCIGMKPEDLPDYKQKAARLLLTQSSCEFDDELFADKENVDYMKESRLGRERFKRWRNGEYKHSPTTAPAQVPHLVIMCRLCNVPFTEHRYLVAHCVLMHLSILRTRFAADNDTEMK